MKKAGVKIAVIGAESTGKSQLAGALADALRSQGKTVALVGEYLREWCDLHGRTPGASEQLVIAHAQMQRVQAAIAAGSQVVIADTTALMTAVYSDMLFNDDSLYSVAAVHQRSYDVTLLTGLDLPWVADGMQRDGPHTREPTDNRLRQAMDSAALPYRVVYGTGAARCENALRAVDGIELIANYSIRTWKKDVFDPQKQPEASAKSMQTVWTWPCEKCSDPDCEHRLFSQLLG